MGPLSRAGAAVVGICCLALTLVGVNAARDDPGRVPRPAVGYPFGGVIRFSPAQRAALSQAQQESVAACMAARGLRYEIPPRLPAVPEPDNPYGLLDEDEARNSGYSLRLHQGQDSQPKDLLKSVPATQRGRWKQALFGTTAHRKAVPLPGGGEIVFNTDGCVQRARTHLYGARWDPLQYTFQALSLQVTTAVERSGPVRAAHRQWAACMKGSGIRASTPQQSRAMVADELKRPAAGAPHRKEVARFELRAATQDARCQRTSALAPAIADTAAREERKILRTRADELHLLNNLKSAALSRVKGELS